MNELDQLRFFCLGLSTGIVFFTLVVMVIGGDR